MEQPKCLNTWREYIIHHGDNDHDHDCVDHLPTTKATATKTMKRVNQQPIDSSWEDYQEEEEALAHDAVRGTQEGSSILWPPRSYSCSFCKREFRSAQALGGHMNVHRRDRALLKQAINIHDDDHDHHHHHHHHHHHDHVMNPCSQPMTLPQNPSQVCSPKTNAAAHQPVSRVSSNNHSAISGISKVITTTNYDRIVQPKVSMGLDLAMGSYQKEEDHKKESSFRYKRFKKSNDEDYDVALFPLFEEIKCSNIKDNRDLEVPEIYSLRASKSMEDLDLELRLGGPNQKIK